MSYRLTIIQPDHEHLPQAVMILTKTTMKMIKHQSHSRTISDRIDSKWLQRVLTVSWPKRERVAEDDKNRDLAADIRLPEVLRKVLGSGKCESMWMRKRRSWAGLMAWDVY
jgi:phosphoribosylaminoimidazole carboxylase (NCAIR synthetase)